MLYLETRAAKDSRRTLKLINRNLTDKAMVQIKGYKQTSKITQNTTWIQANLALHVPHTCIVFLIQVQAR